jgi:hypothetical protein
MLRLPYFLDHHRRMGVAHFLFVDNGSTDGTLAYLAKQTDVSVWKTAASYRKARFGMDWMNALLMRFGSGHWCLTLDADEYLSYPHEDTRSLKELTDWLDANGEKSFAAMMLDLYAQGPLDQFSYTPGQAVTDALPHYDAFNYSWNFSKKYRDIQIQGGPRARVLFGEDPDLIPYLHKVPLVRWNWRYAYVSSTHVALPDMLNSGFDARRNLPTGILLHSKLLPELGVLAAQDGVRAEYHHAPADYTNYYEQLQNSPIFAHPNAQTYSGWRGLERDGLLVQGKWR